MSRIGKLPITVPAGVEITLGEKNMLTVKGPKGTLSRKLPEDMNIAVEDGKITVERPNDLKRSKSLHGLTRSLINNMVTGVFSGFTKKLEVRGTGYRAAKDGNKLTLTVGYSHPIIMFDPEGVTTTIESSAGALTRLSVTGIDKEKVGQYAANIRSKRPPATYSEKGIQYADEKVVRKPGKSGKK